jgi:hypothetical protein
MREQPAERAIVRMDRTAALLGMIFYVNPRYTRRVGDEPRIGDDRKRRRRHLDDGDSA